VTIAIAAGGVGSVERQVLRWLPTLRLRSTTHWWKNERIFLHRI
jgi:hypothetical protein